MMLTMMMIPLGRAVSFRRLTFVHSHGVHSYMPIIFFFVFFFFSNPLQGVWDGAIRLGL